MQAECSVDLFGFPAEEGRRVEVTFDASPATSDAGALLLGATDRAVRSIERLSGCFDDARWPVLIEHETRTLVGQRVYGIALGYEDVDDHDHDE